jgi:hypothetical protein
MSTAFLGGAGLSIAIRKQEQQKEGQPNLDPFRRLSASQDHYRPQVFRHLHD